MATLNQTQIALIKSLTAWSNTRFHGNTKTVNGLSVDLIKSIVLKKKSREIAKQNNARQTPLQVVSRLIKTEGQYIGTPYFKAMIEGSTGIYLASPAYGHSDYNKCRLFDKTESTIKLMELYNTYFSRKLQN